MQGSHARPAEKLSCLYRNVFKYFKQDHYFATTLRLWKVISTRLREIVKQSGKGPDRHLAVIHDRSFKSA